MTMPDVPASTEEVNAQSEFHALRLVVINHAKDHLKRPSDLIPLLSLLFADMVCFMEVPKSVAHQMICDALDLFYSGNAYPGGRITAANMREAHHRAQTEAEAKKP